MVDLFVRFSVVGANWNALLPSQLLTCPSKVNLGFSFANALNCSSLLVLIDYI